MTKNELDAISKQMDSQNAEFKAVDTLATRWRMMQTVAIVDDDYPAVRHGYESAVRALIDAMKANGRLPNA